MKKATKKATGLTRIDHPPRKTHGWMVRLKRGDYRVHEFFSDKKHGGKRKAKSAAAARYAELLSAAPPPLPIKNRRTSRNKTGKVGVRVARDVSRRDETQEYRSYVAFWTDPRGVQRSLKFSLNKYGETRAFLLACIARDHETADRQWVEAEYERLRAQRSLRRLLARLRRGENLSDAQNDAPPPVRPAARKLATEARRQA